MALFEAFQINSQYFFLSGGGLEDASEIIFLFLNENIDYDPSLELSK